MGDKPFICDWCTTIIPDDNEDMVLFFPMKSMGLYVFCNNKCADAFKEQNDLIEIGSTMK